MVKPQAKLSDHQSVQHRRPTIADFWRKIQVGEDLTDPPFTARIRAKATSGEIRNPMKQGLVYVGKTLAHAAAIVAFWAPLTAGAADIRIGGTGNALGTMRLLGEAFAQSHPESKPVILGSIGTSGALKAIPKGAIEIGLASRPLTDDEIKGGLTAVEYARCPTVFAVQSRSKVTGITLAQVGDIYSGKLTQWPDGSTIRLVMRQPNDDNTRQIKQLSPAIEKALLVADQRPGQTFAANDQEAADKMESIPGSIGVTTVALIQSEKRSLRPLSLDGIEPSPKNAQSGRYPMLKSFYFVLPKEPSAAVQEFVKFVRSAPGQKILEQTGHTIP
jgi:phosphate transport system substrate-binding protein